MFLQVHNFNDFLETASAVHVLAKLNGVLAAGANDLGQHRVIGNLDDSLRHVVAERIHHQLIEVFDGMIEDDLENLLVLVLDKLLNKPASTLVPCEHHRMVQELNQALARQHFSTF